MFVALHVNAELPKGAWDIYPRVLLSAEARITNSKIGKGNKWTKDSSVVEGNQGVSPSTVCDFCTLYIPRPVLVSAWQAFHLRSINAISLTECSWRQGLLEAMVTPCCFSSLVENPTRILYFVGSYTRLWQDPSTIT